MTCLTDDSDILALVAADTWRMAALTAVAGLGLPDCWIGAGFARGAVWDRLHGYTERTPLDDIDVVYFDPETRNPAAEASLERRLGEDLPGLPWEVRNQARMHLRNGDPPYCSSADALAHWLETPTAVALRLNHGGELELLAPLGTADLLDLVVRPFVVGVHQLRTDRHLAHVVQRSQYIRMVTLAELSGILYIQHVP